MKKLLLIFILVGCSYGAWDNTEPGDTRLWNLAAGYIRANWDALETAFGVDLASAVASGGNVSFGTITASGLITANAGVTLGTDDDLIGSSTSDITFNTNKFTVAGATGNTLIAGTLDVTGNIDPTTYETTNGGFLDENDMASDSANKVASQQSIKAYVDLSDINGTPTAVFTKYFTGTTDADDTTEVTHSVTSALTKILHISGAVADGAAFHICDYDRTPTEGARGYYLAWNATKVIIGDVEANNQSQAYVIKIDYIL